MFLCTHRLSLMNGWIDGDRARGAVRRRGEPRYARVTDGSPAAYPCSAV